MDAAAGPTSTQTEAIESAASAGLHYVNDDAPGYSYWRKGNRISLRDASGRVVRDPATLRRVRALVLPPAWRDVWIAADPKAHLQATGRDARGRKQYRYHPEWTTIRDASKFDRMTAFARALPRIRRRVARDLRAPSLSRAYVLATVVTLLERTHLRIGNEEYVRQNGSHGLTTLRNRHVRVRGPRMQFDFRAKSGVRQTVVLEDARLATAVRRCQDLPGQLLFQYVDDSGEIRSITSSDVNAYLQDITGDSFTAKDFRTWAGTLVAARALDAIGIAGSKAACAKAIVGAVDQVASALGNPRAVCRRCYIHPMVFERYETGVTIGGLTPSNRVPRGLLAPEAGLLALLEPRDR